MQRFAPGVPVASFAHWATAHAEEPWLILGKGPTFDLRDRVDFRGFLTVGLNHVVQRQRVDVAHAIDIDVVQDCQYDLPTNAQWLLVPWHPHVRCQPTPLTLADFLPTLPVLADFARAGRLLTYDLLSGPTRGPGPTATGSFSASVVVDLLGKSGVRRVRTLGVDGGQTYGNTFGDLSDRTLLANGRSSFDIQFAEIRQSAQQWDMEVQPMVEPIRIFVGCDDSQMVAAKVLEYSMRKHTRRPLEVFFMRNSPAPMPRHRRNQPGTGFSFNRFLIPKLVGYQGKAVYTDADMLVFHDLEDLWETPMNGKKALCSTQNSVPKAWEATAGSGRHWTPGRQMSVMLMDCSQLHWDVERIVAGLDAGQYSYKDLMAKFCLLSDDEIGDSIPNEWNCLEWYEAERSKLVHFTVVPTQPWKNDESPLVGLWTDAYREAVAAGAVPIELIEDSVTRRLVKPELLTIARQILANPARQRPTVTLAETPCDESVQLRQMLWDSMVDQRLAADRVNRSLTLRIEETMVRRPLALSSQVAIAGARRIKRLLRPAA